MKKIIRPALFIAVAAIGLSTTSCKKGCTNEAATNFDDKAKDNDGSCIFASSGTDGLADGSTLPSEVNDGEEVKLLANASYKLSGAITVREGGVLTIPEGVTITAEGAAPESMFLAVEMGGMINATGTSTNPIILTAADQNPGAWGGVSIAGRATANTGVDQEAEIAGLLYGGTDDADNSGTLKYVRVEYSGAQINADKQFNGFSFYAVGSGTTLEYLQSYKGQDDGIEFFGGTVNISYAVSTGSGDDSFDFAEGWRGTATNIYIRHIAGIVQDKGIEGDNLKSNPLATPVSNPTIKNVTIVSDTTVKNSDAELVDGIRIREGAKGTFDNIVIKNFGDEGIDARSLSTLQNLNDGSLKFTNVFVEGTSSQGKTIDAKIDDGETDPGTVTDDAKTVLNAAIVTTEPAGANFDAWKGSWTR